MTTGVLGVQGAFAAHIEVLERLGEPARLITQPHDLDHVQRVILPGGESTTQAKLMHSAGLFEPLQKLLADGLPVLGTCAGAILLANHVMSGAEDQTTLAVLDVDIERNAYGRQINSFSHVVAMAVPAVQDFARQDFEGVFIRAPRIAAVGSAVDVLGSVRGDPVFVQSGSILATTFHPELAGDGRIHEYFLSSV